MIPPSTKMRRKPSEKSSGVVNRTVPFHSVATSAKTCTPLGTAIRRLTPEKNAIASAGRPVANMWCTHTPKLMNAMATSAVATQM